MTVPPCAGAVELTVQGRLDGLQLPAAGGASATNTPSAICGAAPPPGVVATAKTLILCTLWSPNNSRKLQLWMPAASLLKATWTLTGLFWLTAPVAGTGAHQVPPSSVTAAEL